MIGAIGVTHVQPGNPVEHFGRQLAAAGYSFHGGETMISGITGEEFAVR